MKVLTITVPTYNMERYLANCLDSFLLKKNMDKLEVLIVNDGSKDKSAEIAQQYVDKYPDTFQLINKENGGHGSTINEGLKHATGKYFKIIDSDDWVNKAALDEYIDSLQNLDIELVITPYNTVNEVTGSKQTVSIKLPREQFGKIINIEDYIVKNRLLMHMITYKTDFLKKIKLTLDIHTFYVDLEYIHFALPYLTKCCCLNYYLYQYRINQAEQSCSISGYIKHRNEHAKVILHCLKYRRHRKERYRVLKLYEYALKQMYELTDVQYRIYLSDIGNPRTRKELAAFDHALEKQCPEIYQATEHLPYIKNLRKTNFNFLLLQQLYFKYKQAKGSYKELSF